MSPYLQKSVSALLLVSVLLMLSSIPLDTKAGLLGDAGKILAVATGTCVAGKIGGKILSLGAHYLKVGLKKVGAGLLKAAENAPPPFGPVIKSVSNFFKGFFGGKKVTTTREDKDSPIVSKLDEISMKECIMKPFMTRLSTMLIRSLNHSLLMWIQGYDPNGRNNVGFVGNLRDELRKELNLQAGQFINQITGINMCGNINYFVRLRLQLPSERDSYYGLNRALGCTASGVVSNIKYTYNDFQRNFRGGWPAYVSYSLTPQNNPYGAYLIALDAKVSAETATAQNIQTGYQVGAGFLGFQVEEKNCEPINVGGLRKQVVESLGIQDTGLAGGSSFAQEQRIQKAINNKLKTMGAEKDKNGNLIDPPVTCTSKRVTKTPGQTAAFLLNKSLGSGIDVAVVGNEMDNLISSVIQASINKLIGGSSGKGRGMFDKQADLENQAGNGLANAASNEEAAQDTTAEGTDQGPPINIPILALLAKTDGALDYLEQNILTSIVGNITQNISSGGIEIAPPPSGVDIEPNTVFDPGVAQNVYNTSREQIATAIYLSRGNYASYKDHLKTKADLIQIKKEALGRLWQILENGENIQEPLIGLGISNLDIRLTNVLSGSSVPLAPQYTLYGNTDNNLRKIPDEFQKHINTSANKIVQLDNINFRSLPTLNVNQYTDIERWNSLLHSSYRQTFIDLQQKLNTGNLDESDPNSLRQYLLNNIDNFNAALDTSLKTDETIAYILGIALDITPDQPASASGSTGSATPTTQTTPIYQPPASGGGIFIPPAPDLNYLNDINYGP